MMSCPESVLNQIRAFQTFEELHGTRAVSKRWNSVEDVPKVIDCTTMVGAPFACFKSIRKIHLRSSSKNTDYLLQRMLNESRNSLVDVHIKFFDANRCHIPILKNVKKVCIENSTIRVDKILKKFPILERISIQSVEGNDIWRPSLVPNLRHVRLDMDTPKDIGAVFKDFKELHISFDLPDGCCELEDMLACGSILNANDKLTLDDIYIDNNAYGHKLSYMYFNLKADQIEVECSEGWSGKLERDFLEEYFRALKNSRDVQWTVKIADSVEGNHALELLYAFFKRGITELPQFQREVSFVNEQV